MAKFLLTKKRSAAWETIKEGETIVIEISASSLHYSDVSKYLEKIGKTGSQFKFPRVISKKQKEDWLAFVEEK
jgi:hypothetical protein